MSSKLIRGATKPHIGKDADGWYCMVAQSYSFCTPKEHTMRTKLYRYAKTLVDRLNKRKKIIEAASA